MTSTPLRAAPPAVRRTVSVTLPVLEAFALFTGCMDQWWPLVSHSCSGDRAARIEVQKWLGGSVLEQAPGGKAHVWGKITNWDPPHAFAMTWYPGQAADQATELRVEFTADGPGACEVCIVHGGWDRRPDARDSYERGWQLVLDQFVRACGRP